MKNIQKIGNKIKVTETVESEVDTSVFIAQEEGKLAMIEMRITHTENELDRLKAERVEIKKNLKDFKV